MIALSNDKSIYELIGKFIVLRKPEVAKSVLSELPVLTDPIDTNLSQIPKYYNSLDNPDKRVFIAYILHIYSPSVFVTDLYPVKRGLNIAISKTLGQEHSFTSRLIKECINHYKVYSDFKQKVDELLQRRAA